MDQRNFIKFYVANKINEENDFNRWIAIREIASDISITFGSWKAVFTYVLGMKLAQKMLTIFSNDPDLRKKVITGDESWVYGYDIETKAQSSQQKRPEKPFFRIVKNRKYTSKHD